MFREDPALFKTENRTNYGINNPIHCITKNSNLLSAKKFQKSFEVKDI